MAILNTSVAHVAAITALVDATAGIILFITPKTKIQVLKKTTAIENQLGSFFKGTRISEVMKETKVLCSVLVVTMCVSGLMARELVSVIYYTTLFVYEPDLETYFTLG